MRDLQEILDRLRDAPPDAALALATIVRVAGSSYRREGARLLIEPDGRLTGMLSAGCLERDLAAQARAIVGSGAARAIEYDLTEEGEAIWGTGTGCSGHVTLLVEPLDTAGRARWIERLETPLETRHEVRLATLYAVSPAASTEAPGIGDSYSLHASPSSSFSGADSGVGAAAPVNAEASSDRGFPVKGEPGGERDRRSAYGASGRSPSDSVGSSKGLSTAETGSTLPTATDSRPGAGASAGDSGWNHGPFPSMPAFSKLEGGATSASDETPPWRALAARELVGLSIGEARSVRVSIEGLELSLLVESIPPPIHLLIVGSERDAPALARLGGDLGWACTVVDPRPTEAAAARFAATARYLGAAPRELAGAVELSARTAVVLATHRYLDDLAYLAEIGDAAVGYLALLGPVSRRRRLLDDLEKLAPGSAGRLDAHLAGPAGLDLGGRRPEEVALAIVAEIQSRFSGRDARPLGHRAADATPRTAPG